MKKTAFNDNWTCNGQPVTLPHDAMIREPRRADAKSGIHPYMNRMLFADSIYMAQAFKSLRHVLYVSVRIVQFL